MCARGVSICCMVQGKEAKAADGDKKSSKPTADSNGAAASSTPAADQDTPMTDASAPAAADSGAPSTSRTGQPTGAAMSAFMLNCADSLVRQAKAWLKALLCSSGLMLG